MRLSLDRPPSHDRDDFVVSTSNRAAVTQIDDWPAWPDGCLALVGLEGVGKTHLARAWAARAGAVVLEGDLCNVSHLSGRAVLLEDADRRPADDALFQILNMTAEGTTLLVTGRNAPALWPTRLADMRSRLNVLHVAKIDAPDDIVLRGVMLKLFRERNIKPSDDVLNYLVKRIERSVPAAQDIVQRIDDFADAERREITRAVARQILDDQEETLDLFK